MGNEKRSQEVDTGGLMQACTEIRVLSSKHIIYLAKMVNHLQFSEYAYLHAHAVIISFKWYMDLSIVLVQ